jgi:serine/threonine protein kinase
MHSLDIIHGDLKCVSVFSWMLTVTHESKSNILVDESGNACLTDFGLSTTLHISGTAFSVSTASPAGTVRFMAPELLNQDPNFTAASDVYALGMVIYEVRRWNVLQCSTQLLNALAFQRRIAICRSPQRPERDPPYHVWCQAFSSGRHGSFWS